jgi:hypothetical protein
MAIPLPPAQVLSSQIPIQNWLCLSLSLSLMLRPTVSRPVCLRIKHPFGDYEHIFITCVTVTVLFLWGVLSDERTGLSFVYAAGPCQSSLSRARVPWDSRPYFTVSDLRLPFPSPPTTRRVTVEVFDPASTRGWLCLTLFPAYNISARTTQRTPFLLHAYPLQRERVHRAAARKRPWYIRPYRGRSWSNSLKLTLEKMDVRPWARFISLSTGTNGWCFWIR